MSRHALTAPRVFDGTRLLSDHAVVLDGDQIAALTPAAALPPGTPRTPLDGILAPGFVDLQVNGGGGVMLNDAPTADTMARIAGAHARLGTTTLLPTLITDTPAQTGAAIAAAVEAAGHVPGIGGLHLEGPHLDPRRAGAHDPALIRAMTDDDLAQLSDAARRLPTLLITLAPEAARADQIAALRAAGAVVSLGHSDTDYDAARQAEAAGATMVTHLFNAMSPLGHRAPGLVGAALDCEAWAGIIADGVHVHPAALRLALRAKPGRLFLVTDAMAPAGTDLDRFTLNGREIRRNDGRLTLAEGTLAGADLDLPRALRLVRGLGLSLEETLAIATSRPAEAIGRSDLGRLAAGADANLVHLSDDLKLLGTWQSGVPV